MKKNRKVIYILVCLVMVLTIASGCDKGGKEKLPKGAAENEILTLKPVDQNKEMVTIHYEYGIDNADVLERSIEEAFPNVDIVMVFDGATDSSSMMKNGLINGTECDLIIGRYIDCIKDEAEKYLYDLSGEEFINNFYMTSLDSCVRDDGGLYYLPGLSNVYGIIYNKTMFEENGWSVPESYTEFKELIKTIDNSGMTATENIDGVTREVPVRAIRPSIYFADSFQMLFYPYIYDELFSGRENLEWLTEYQNGGGSLVGHMEPFADTIKKLLQDGIIRLEDWDYMPRYRIPMLNTYHSTAMIIGPQSTYTTLQNSDNEYAMMPFWTGDEPGTDYVYSIPTHFMAINKASTDESEERKQLLLDIMAYICSPEGQSNLFGEGNLMVSNVKGITTGTNDFNLGIQKTIQEGRIISDINLLGGGTSSREVEEVLCNNTRDMIEGVITVEEWLKKGDEARDIKLKGMSTWSNEVVGECKESFTRFETSLLMGQIYRDLTGADIALVYVKKSDQGANCCLFKGDLHETDVRGMAPDRTSDGNAGIAYATLKGQQILDCLNGMAGCDDWYYVASGLNVEFAPWMPAGERLVSCKLPDGSEINPEGSYKVAFMSDKLFGNVDGEVALFRPDDISIMEGKWEKLFLQWLENQGGVLTKTDQTTKLIWSTIE